MARACGSTLAVLAAVAAGEAPDDIVQTFGNAKDILKRPTFSRKLQDPTHIGKLRNIIFPTADHITYNPARLDAAEKMAKDYRFWNNGPSIVWGKREVEREVRSVTVFGSLSWTMALLAHNVTENFHNPALTRYIERFKGIMTTYLITAYNIYSKPDDELLKKGVLEAMIQGI